MISFFFSSCQLKSVFYKPLKRYYAKNFLIDYFDADFLSTTYYLWLICACLATYGFLSNFPRQIDFGRERCVAEWRLVVGRPSRLSWLNVREQELES